MTRTYPISARRRKELQEEAEANFRFYSGSCAHGTPPFDKCQECEADQLADEVKDDPYFERVDHEYSEWKDSYRDPEGANGGNRRREP